MADFNRVEGVLGQETVKMIVQREKSLEEAQKMQNRGKKRKIERVER